MNRHLNWGYRRTWIGTQAALLALLAVLMVTRPAPAAEPPARLSAHEAQAIGVEAAIFGLPLVLMDVTRAKQTNVATATMVRAPINQFSHIPGIPNATNKEVVRMNVDTLYSMAWLDLAKEPIVLTVPDSHGRYYVLQMMDAWTNVFASPGKRTTGTHAGTFAITGPGWQGTLPPGMAELHSPTNTVWILGRTQTDGPQDYPPVHAFQNGLGLTPLSGYGKPYALPLHSVDPAVDMKTPPVEQVVHMDNLAFFARLAAGMKANPPAAADAPIVARMARIGIVPGRDFDPAKLDPAVVRGLQGVLRKALLQLKSRGQALQRAVNGWRPLANPIGTYGTDYSARALIAFFGLGANLPEDAIYPTAYADRDNHPLTGAKRYVLHFDKGQTPPANAFWSLTMYTADSYFAENPIHRYAISSWMPLKTNVDGSLDLYLQNEPPDSEQEANWLPAPEGKFNVTLRIYWPQPEAVDGRWIPPGIAPVP